MMGWLEGLKTAADKWNAEARRVKKAAQARASCHAYYLRNREAIRAQQKEYYARMKEAAK